MRRLTNKDVLSIFAEHRHYGVTIQNVRIEGGHIVGIEPDGHRVRGYFMWNQKGPSSLEPRWTDDGDYDDTLDELQGYDEVARKGVVVSRTVSALEVAA